MARIGQIDKAYCFLALCHANEAEEKEESCWRTREFQYVTYCVVSQPPST
ncbi:hypothetical protein SBA5_30024 [Candidatus Sulfotelmatomonas gaucii]|uniref:Uncharacterized protein n=1 Tax=Candidatus Sulfuritelmatomonas gaucii TaxID=2043161 RepID=A0A2N9LBZ8_9BACT|nr:hypothetical protein SBA5_30024 [Candidatus Sulfotelmatomonas gaucii]